MRVITKLALYSEQQLAPLISKVRRRMRNFSKTFFHRDLELAPIKTPIVDRLQLEALFSEQYYLEQLAEIGLQTADPLSHFLTYGEKIGLNPHPLFSTAFYSQQVSARERNGLGPLAHYVTKGWRSNANPHPLFDSQFYREQYPEHERRQLNPLIHYLTKGWLLNVDPHAVFSTSFYRQSTPESDQRNINPLVHYVTEGSDRDPHPLFNTHYYLSVYPHVQKQRINPLVHYLTVGGLNGYDPCSEFDSSYYLVQHPDVAAAGLNPLAHFSRHGKYEGRATQHSIFVSKSALPSHMVPTQSPLGDSDNLIENKSSASPLRILLLLPANPYPPVTGAYMRWWAIIRYLGQRHNLTAVMFSRPLENECRAKLLEFCTKICLVDYEGPRPELDKLLPSSVKWHNTLRMQDAVKLMGSETFDVAIIEQIFLAPYREFIQAPVILAEQNVESSLLAQAAASRHYGHFTAGFEAPEKEAELLRQYEDKVWPEFLWRTAVSEKERSIIQERAKRGETWLVGNGIDVDQQMTDARPDTNNVLFTGMLAYYPNVDGVIYFWKEIWPHVLRLSPSAKLIVAGRSPSRDVTTLAASGGFKLVADPDDMRAIAAQCSISVCPLRIGSGTRLKILEAMAFGLPVVSTSVGCEGLAVEDERDLLIRDDPAEFGLAVHRLLSDAELWKTMRENGRRLVTERYSWDTVLEPLDRLCRKAASEHSIKMT